ncbi:MAG: N-acetylmuramoyl-L-alanine amidase [Candidatus Cloacimonadota bacterium]|nr:MAG: N-acetylmuramoyl-L-alanine amidase [Candidatus Cloacimonadota bacterium]PIE77615.1 MAG: N-acetylmuramoyl-L-alanine amidase [Candidatus Delongbacteria bacterium]
MREINEIVIHCSATEYGNVEIFRDWHVNENGWDDIGYHYVILNSYQCRDDYVNKKPNYGMDGVLEIGRDIEISGAHVKGHNKNSIGICLVGDRSFTSSQFRTLKTLVSTLKSIYKDAKIKGHCEYDTAIAQGKTCPNINPDYLRELLK